MPPPSKRPRLPFKPPRPASNTAKSASPAASTSGANSGRTHKPKPSRQRSKPQATLVSGTPPPKPMAASLSETAEASPSPENRRASCEHSVESLSSDPDYILAEIIPPKEDKRTPLETAEPDFPPKLLAAIIHRHMKQKGEKMRITKDANRLYAKYIDIFIKEAVARAIHERQETLKTDGVERDRIRSMIDSYLEVEDLEKLAPQLLLDF
ncbi:hypothetical protein LOZ39_003379 [Ophidiomyces ophidiicola]|uniref:uncharacterized protein n=1 Tax=Ophidiomyces ophidiicola TaxID=1387563 RepID=UPI0020C2AA13|nr:uncharacterized protein LOZ57_006185 [Ophidiomyces ophidiicola]KAI1916448.1 hypothetical protein LOZ61_001105 [Ophidiomyces ophidiicola]KAI1928822.1 hypothetical protein LOZ60_002114 [Ophidiomyces ophidiicola]KAI1939224.1 hypothetical protein LOZ57_006185 [Ophidiomyces ophidiicola]KAI1960136.1 hypothetical protein LOZ59_002792 [Ophidiomyces ophidiicola]KAI2010184.1 hypothetical protein LOZ49_003583 [Ophidiomyces ophidiicola]